MTCKKELDKESIFLLERAKRHEKEERNQITVKAALTFLWTAYCLIGLYTILTWNPQS